MKDNLHISWESNVDDGSMLSESLTDHVLINIKGQVTAEESVRRWVGRVTELGSSGLSTVLWCLLGSWGREVDICWASIDILVLLGLESSGGRLRLGELNVSETTGSARLLVSDDTGAGDLSELLELTVEPLIINVPAQVADEQVLGSSIGSISLGLLGSSWCLILGFALLAWGSLFLVALIRIRSGFLIIIRARVRRSRVIRIIIGTALLWP